MIPNEVKVQFLRMRARDLEDLVLRQEGVIQALLKDLELTESVGAAFAFDLVLGNNLLEAWTNVEDTRNADDS